MKPAPFKYFAAQHIDQVHELLSEYGHEAALLAGGQSLVPTLNFRLSRPAVLIDLNQLAGLAGLSREGDELSIGAMVRQRTIETSELVEQHSPLLAACMPHVAHYQIRTRGTLGGSLAHADPSAELPAVVSALRGRLRLSGGSSERWLESEDFFKGMFCTAREPDEMLAEIRIPALPPRSGWAFQEFARRHGDYALMGVAVVVSCDPDGVIESARLAYLSAGDGVIRGCAAESCLLGEKVSHPLFQEAARLASESDIEPLEDLHASVAYRRHLARILTCRALEEASRRAVDGCEAEAGAGE